MNVRRTRNADIEEILPIDPEIERTIRQTRARRRREMAEVEENKIVNQQPQAGEVVPVRRKLQEILMPMVAVNPSCIRLSQAARNYELKHIHLTMLPTFNGLTTKDALAFIRDFYSTVQTLPL